MPLASPHWRFGLNKKDVRVGTIALQANRDFLKASLLWKGNRGIKRMNDLVKDLLQRSLN